MAKRRQKPEPEAEPELQSRWTKTRIGVLGTVALGLLGYGIWLATKPPAKTPLQIQQEALDILGEKDNGLRDLRKARKIGQALKDARFQDPDFPGASEYILGLAAFREAQQVDENKQEDRYQTAIQALRSAERLALNAKYRPQWAYALGASLQATGSPATALPYLEEAWESRPDKRKELTRKLIRIYLERKSPKLLEKALTLSEELIASLNTPDADPRELDYAKLLKAQALVALNRTEEAIRTLPEISTTDPELGELKIHQALTLIGLKRVQTYRDAKEILSSLLSESGLEEQQTRQANYLLGVCEELLGDQDQAIHFYDRTASRYPKSHEGVAAALKQSRLLQAAGRDEETLAALELALKSVTDPTTHHNRWMNIEQFRERVLQAWTNWIEAEKFTDAIALCRRMPPLLTKVQSVELEARSYEKWAQSYEAANSLNLRRDPKTYRSKIQERWNASGDSFADLADLMKSSPKYSDVLWKSAEDYLKAHRYQKAKELLERFLETAPQERLPIATVKLAYTLLSQDQTEEALALLRNTIERHPKDPAAFQASYLSGLAHLEREEISEALQTWRDLIEVSLLGPTAREWRASLFALGSTLYYTTSAKVASNNNWERQLLAKPSNVESQDQAESLPWDEALEKLNEYVNRYPGKERYHEAQYLLARSYQKSAQGYLVKLQNAQIANEKQELTREYQSRLGIAAQILQDLRADLMRREESPGLTPYESRLLQNTFFDLGDIQYAMKEFQQAILVYSNAINRYPNHVRVLSSYLQMARCYQNLNQPEEARSTIKQAQILIRRMNDDLFQSPSTNLKSREEWEEWLQWSLDMLSRPEELTQQN